MVVLCSGCKSPVNLFRQSSNPRRIGPPPHLGRSFFPLFPLESFLARLLLLFLRPVSLLLVLPFTPTVTHTLTRRPNLATAADGEIGAWIGSFLPPGAQEEVRVFGSEEQARIFES